MRKDDHGPNIAEQLIILQGAVENTNEAFVTIDEDHRVIFFNRAAEKIFGYRREELLGGDLNAILSPRCSENHRQAVARYLGTRTPKLIGHETEFVAYRKNGETVPVSISFSVAEVKGDTFFTAIIRDLTETKAMQEQIFRSERLAALGELAAEITHEVKNPLMLIGGFARQLAKMTQDDRMVSKVRIIVNEVERLEKLLAEIRGYYLPRQLIREKFDVDMLLRELYDLVKENSKTRNIQVKWKNCETPCWFFGDRDKLKQVFLNLVNNALEAIEKDGTITIRTQLHDEMIEVVITDNGPGIPEEDQEKIFHPFFSTKPQGTGLGLSVCKKIIEEHQGSSFALTSKPGGGTTVRINLPRLQDKAKN